MTEGIIQKVFNEYRNRTSKRLDGIDGLEQELIKEIDKAKHESLFVQDLETFHRIVFLDILIGETKE